MMVRCCYTFLIKHLLRLLLFYPFSKVCIRLSITSFLSFSYLDTVFVSFMNMQLSTRVAICGAGPSGISQLHAFESARQGGSQIPEIVCFEKQNDLGGQWNQT